MNDRQPSPLTAYSVRVYVAGDDDRDLDGLIDALDHELHDDLFRLARRLERVFGVDVVAVDESGAGWIAGGLGCRPELAQPSPATPPAGTGDVVRRRRDRRSA